MICPVKGCNTEMRVIYKNTAHTEYMCPRLKCQACVSRSNVIEKEEQENVRWGMEHRRINIK
jgi:hypothetical protein